MLLLAIAVAAVITFLLLIVMTLLAGLFFAAFTVMKKVCCTRYSDYVVLLYLNFPKREMLLHNYQKNRAFVENFPDILNYMHPAIQDGDRRWFTFLT
jgi:hypothetical protein